MTRTYSQRIHASAKVKSPQIFKSRKKFRVKFCSGMFQKQISLSNNHFLKSAWKKKLSKSPLRNFGQFFPIKWLTLKRQGEIARGSIQVMGFCCANQARICRWSCCPYLFIIAFALIYSQHLKCANWSYHDMPCLELVTLNLSVSKFDKDSPY